MSERAARRCEARLLGVSLSSLAADPVDRELSVRTAARRRLLLAPTARSAHPAPPVAAR